MNNEILDIKTIINNKITSMLENKEIIILDEIIRWYKEQKYGYEKCKHQIQELFKGGE